MAEDHKSHRSEAVVSEKGLLDVFKKEKDDEHQSAESVHINVSKFKKNNEEKEKEKEKMKEKEEEEEEVDHQHGLKLHDSDGSSSSSGEEEGDSEEKKTKKKEKSLKDKIKAKICGEEEKPKAEAVEVAAVKEDMKKEEVAKVVEVEGHEPPEKKGILEKIKEKIPGGDSSPVPPPRTTWPSLADTVAQKPEPEGHCNESGGPETETKGIVEKIKEKLPGYHPKNTEGGEEANH